MSDYLSQHATPSAFGEGAVSSFVILSDIEQRIKEKIEKVGTPLRDWDIQINYGIKTGYNEAFIIDGATKDRLIKNSPKNAEIIRPILRGRDIKRYGYEFADLWVILARYGSHKYLKSLYPSIYEYLLHFEEKLKNRGQCKYSRDRKKGKNNNSFEGQHHWLELDNNPQEEYLNNFLPPKIIYPNMTKYMPFLLDSEGFYINDKAFFVTGEHLEFLTAFLNSSIFKYCFRENFPELQGGTRELRKIFFDSIPIKKIDDKTNNLFCEKVLEIQHLKSNNEYTKDKEIAIDNMIFDLYNLTEEERNTIGFIEIQ